MDAVKSPSAPTRAERTRLTRRRMVESARELFVSQGYAATTMSQVARAAGVAVQTIYYTFGTKGKLLCEVVETTASGERDRGSAGQPPWVAEMLTADDPQRVLAIGVEHGTAIYDRVASLWPTVAGAAESDAEVADYWRGVASRRQGAQRAMVARIDELGAIREDLSVDRAGDLVVVLLGHDVYRGLVVDAAWSPDAYRTWVLTTLVGQLLGAAPEESVTGDLPSVMS
jgi:TetR/AcrR family transcriptional regulator of autoinduction and epiphytic fitness